MRKGEQAGETNKAEERTAAQLVHALTTLTCRTPVHSARGIHNPTQQDGIRVMQSAHVTCIDVTIFQEALPDVEKVALKETSESPWNTVCDEGHWSSPAPCQSEIRVESFIWVVAGGCFCKSGGIAHRLGHTTVF